MVAGDSGSTDACADELSTEGEVGGEGPGETCLGARALRGFAVALVDLGVLSDLGVFADFFDFLARPNWAKTFWNIFLPTNLL
jgi:hypothetical protein